MLYQDAVDVFVDHDEILCDYSKNESMYEDDTQAILLAKIKKLINDFIIDGNEDIKYWHKGKNLFAEETADKIAERNEKLKKLLGMETINADLLKKLIDSETDDELIVIYEEILEYLETSDETEDE